VVLRRISVGALGWLILISSAHAKQAQLPLLAPIFSDHMVLQRERPVLLWGRAPAYVEVVVGLAGREQRTSADAQGKWRVAFPAMTAGRGHRITVSSGSATQNVSDVAVGDVFLCSGQSNMEFPVYRSLNPQFGITKPIDGNIRFMKIERAAAPAPLDRLPEDARWSIPDEASISDFSAVCMFFGREVAMEKKVPVGLIQASWGGTQIEAWIAADELKTQPGFTQQVDLLDQYAKSPALGYQAFGSFWEKWWRNSAPSAGEPWKMDGAAIARLPAIPALGNWRSYSDDLARHVGMLWFYKPVTLDGAQVPSIRRLRLGGFNEIGTVWINGRFVGSSGNRQRNIFDVPAGALKSGANVITVNILQTNPRAPAGLYGPAEEMALEGAGDLNIPLGAGWRYAKAPRRPSQPPRAPWEDRFGLTNIYNGMIAPIGPMPLAGVVWYQGESNVRRADAYQSLLETMLASWRKQFRTDLPFVIVQIANFGALSNDPNEGGSTRIREAQRRVAEADSNAALAVTIDVGERLDIHPPLKQPVAERVMQAARSVIYGEEVAPSGPAALGARLTSAGVSIAFRDVSGGLKAVSSGRPSPFILCDEKANDCRFADAILQGERVVVAVPSGFVPYWVRYCWAVAPLCNLYDASSAPVGPFELQVER